MTAPAQQQSQPSANPAARGALRTATGRPGGPGSGAVGDVSRAAPSGIDGRGGSGVGGPVVGGPAAGSAVGSATQGSGAAAVGPVRKRRLLLATDLGEASASATDQAFELAASLGASLLAVSVIDPGSLLLPGGRYRARVDQVRERLEREAQTLVARGRRDGIDVSFLVWTGDPGDQIVAAAEAESVDMIVVGSHGRGTVGRLLLGSVSEHVVRNAGCPVLVVR